MCNGAEMYDVLTMDGNGGWLMAWLHVSGVGFARPRRVLGVGVGGLGGRFRL